MNHPIKTFALALAGLALTGCGDVAFLYPLAEHPEDLAADVDLSGEWKTRDNDHWIFEKRADGAYDLTWRNDKDKETLRFDASAVRLSNWLFLDIASHKAVNSISGHSFARLQIDGDRLELAWLDGKWIEAKLARERALAFERPCPGKEKRCYVVTAPSADLQNFLLRHVTDPAAFGDPDILHH